MEKEAMEKEVRTENLPAPSVPAADGHNSCSLTM
jgi:hypothetical protein